MGNGMEMDADAETGTKAQSRLMDDSELSGLQATRERPVFAQHTPAKVVAIAFKEQGRKEIEDATEVRITMAIELELEKPLPSGDKKVFSNYGFRVFERKTGKSLYWGKTTDMSKLRDLICDTFGLDAKTVQPIGLKDALMGKTVFIKSEPRPNPTTKTEVQKAVIKQIKLA